MTYTQFKQEWQGRRIDYDHVFAYQCVDLILEYAKECFGISHGVSGNAIDYWTHTSPALLMAFTRVASKDAKQGDIVVFYGHPGNPDGHIGICDHADSTNVYVLEQNASGDASGLGISNIGVHRPIPKIRIAGLLRPKTAAQPAPKPASGTATVIREAYVRLAPTTLARTGGSVLLYPGNTFKYKAKVRGQDINQNGVHTNIWYQSVYGHYVWSGNCKG